MFICVCETEEKKTVQGVQRRLWELLASAGLTNDSGSSPWLHAYRRLLQEDGVDEETQRKALLMQLWASQASQATEEWLSHSEQRKEFSWEIKLKDENRSPFPM